MRENRWADLRNWLLACSMHRGDRTGLHRIGARGVRNDRIKKSGLGGVDGESPQIWTAAEIHCEYESAGVVFHHGLGVRSHRKRATKSGQSQNAVGTCDRVPFDDARGTSAHLAVKYVNKIAG